MTKIHTTVIRQSWLLDISKAVCQATPDFPDYSRVFLVLSSSWSFQKISDQIYRWTLNFPPRRKKHKQKKGMNHDTAISQSTIWNNKFLKRFPVCMIYISNLIPIWYIGWSRFGPIWSDLVIRRTPSTAPLFEPEAIHYDSWYRTQELQCTGHHFFHKP